MFRGAAVAASALGVGLVAALTACGGGGDPPRFSVTPVVTAGTAYQNPRDAVPGAGGAVYFTADGPGGPGVFVATAEGGEARALAVGRPFARPAGITISTDERSLYVADPQADVVYRLPVAGGPPVALEGSTGLAPQGLEVKGDQLYVTGVDPAGGKPAVLVMPTSGGSPKVLATGLILPEGIAVTDDGTVFVADRFTGTIARVADGKATALRGVKDLSLGEPAGLALTPDSAGLLVSALNSEKGTAQVLIVDIASGSTRVFDDVIGANHGAGGLHKAHDGLSYAWCDVSRSGGVYRIEP